MKIYSRQEREVTHRVHLGLPMEVDFFQDTSCCCHEQGSGRFGRHRLGRHQLKLTMPRSSGGAYLGAPRLRV